MPLRCWSRRFGQPQRFPLMILTAEQPFDTWQVVFFPLHGLGFYITSRWFRIWAMGFYEWRYEDDVLCFQKLVHVGAESVSQWLPCCFCKKSWARSHGQGQEEGCRGGMHIAWTNETGHLSLFSIMIPLVETCSNFNIHGNPWLVFQHGNSNP